MHIPLSEKEKELYIGLPINIFNKTNLKHRLAECFNTKLLEKRIQHYSFCNNRFKEKLGTFYHNNFGDVRNHNIYNIKEVFSFFKENGVNTNQAILYDVTSQCISEQYLTSVLNQYNEYFVEGVKAISYNSQEKQENLLKKLKEVIANKLKEYDITTTHDTQSDDNKDNPDEYSREKSL